MTALPARQPEAAPAQPSTLRPALGAGLAIIADQHVPGLYWVPVDLAAQTLGVSDRALRMKGEELKEAGFAKQMSPTVGGQKKWHFSSRYDARLAALVRSQPQHAQADVAEATEAFKRYKAAPESKKKGARSKAEAVKMFREWKRVSVVSEAAAQRALFAAINARCGIQVTSLSRLYQWNDLVGTHDLSSAAGYQAACWELLDRRGGNTDARYSDLAWADFKARLLTGGGGRMSVGQCWKATRAEAKLHGWEWPSLGHVHRLVKERIPAGVRVLARDGFDVWRRYHLPSIQQDENAWGAGQMWETDHQVCNYFVRVVNDKGEYTAVRPQMTVFIDHRTRRVMGWVLSLQGNSDTIRQALHRALSRDDVYPPEYIVLDNGKDFAASQFCGKTKAQRRAAKKSDASGGGNDPNPDNREWIGLFGMLGIEPRFCIPKNPNGKPIIESFFRVIQMGFDRTQSNWCGTDREPLAPEKHKALLANPAKLPTLDEMARRTAVWMAAYDVNAERNIDALIDDEGIRRSPREWYQRHAAARPMLCKTEALECVEQQWDQPVTPTKDGVSIRIGKKRLWYGQHHPEIQNLVGSGKRVHVVFNPDDLNYVRVHDEKFRKICDVPLNSKHGGPTTSPMAKQDVKAAVRRQARHAAATRREIDLAAALSTDAELAALEHFEREARENAARIRAEGLSDNPPSMRLNRTPLSDALSDQASSIPLRKAAGAEHDNFPPAAQGKPQQPDTRGAALRITDDDFEDDDESTPSIPAATSGTRCAPTLALSEDDFENEPEAQADQDSPDILDGFDAPGDEDDNDDQPTQQDAPAEVDLDFVGDDTDGDTDDAERDWFERGVT